MSAVHALLLAVASTFLGCDQHCSAANACTLSDSQIRACGDVTSGVYGASHKSYRFVGHAGPLPPDGCSATNEATVIAFPASGGAPVEAQVKDGLYQLALVHGDYELCADRFSELDAQVSAHEVCLPITVNGSLRVDVDVFATEGPGPLIELNPR
jgi:hypothetical protein